MQITSPLCVEVIDQPTPDLRAGQVRVRTSFSGISAGTELTAYRGSNPYLNKTWDPDLRLFIDDTSGLSYPLAGLGYSEVGQVVEVAPDVAEDPGLPPVGAHVWGIWGHRGEAVLPAEKLRGCTVPAGLDPIAATFARVGAVALNAVLAADVHLGETVAVPLFRHLREPCTHPVAKSALDRILRDEVRHRDFGWDLLDWLLCIDDSVGSRVASHLPAMFADLERSYGTGNDAVTADDGVMTAEDRAWGLAPPREYAEILARTFHRDFLPRFAARDIGIDRSGRER